MRIMRQAPGSQNFNHIEPMDTHVITLCKASSEPNLFGLCRAQPKMSRKPLLETNVCARRAWNYALSAFQAQTLHEYEPHKLFLFAHEFHEFSYKRVQSRTVRAMPSAAENVKKFTLISFNEQNGDLVGHTNLTNFRANERYRVCSYCRAQP